MRIDKNKALEIIKQTVEKHTKDYTLTRFKRRNINKVERHLIYALRVKSEDSISDPIFDELSDLVYEEPAIDVIESEVIIEDKATVDLILIKINTKR